MSRPLAEWRFDRNSSSVLLDSSGNGYHSLIRGPGVSFLRDAASNTSYMRFNGSTDVVDFPTTSFEFGLRNFAVEATLRYSSYAVLAAKRTHSNSSSDATPWVTFVYQGLFCFQISINVYCSTRAVNDSAWHTVRAERRNGMCSLFVDGSLDGGGACNFSIANGLRFSLLSQYVMNTYTHRFIGDIAKIAIYVDNALGGPLC